MLNPCYRNFALTFVAALLTGCAATLRIPEGTYTNAQGAGSLTVSSERVEVRLPKGDALTPSDYGSYGYSLFSDGSVQLYGSSNSSYYLFLVYDYQWRWTGTAFEARNRHDGTVVTFTPAPVTRSVPVCQETGNVPIYSASLLLTKATCAPSGDHDGTLMVPWPP